MKKLTLIFIVSLGIFLGGCALVAGCIAMGGPTQFIWTSTGLKGVRSWPGSPSQWLDRFFQVHHTSDRVEDAVDHAMDEIDRVEEGVENWIENFEDFDWDLDWEEDHRYDSSGHDVGSEEVAAFSSIDADLVCADLVLVESDCYKVSYILPKERKLELLQVENGVLRLKQKKTLNVVSFSVGEYRSRIEVSYPKGADLGKISLTSVSGDLQMSRALVKEMDFHSTSGDFTAEEAASLEICEVSTVSGDGELSGPTGLKRLSMKTTSGDLNLENTAFSGEVFEFSSVSGDIDLTDCRIDNTQAARLSSVSGDFLLKDTRMNEVNLKTTSGDIEGKSLECGEVNVSSTSGSINLSGALKGSISVSSVSSSIRLKTTLPESQYSYDLSSRGGIQFNGETKGRSFQQGGAPYSIQGTGGSGRIDIQTGK